MDIIIQGKDDDADDVKACTHKQVKIPRTKVEAAMNKDSEALQTNHRGTGMIIIL